MAAQVAFYIQVAHVLEEIGAPYMIVGAFAGLAFGITRATFDVDMLVDLSPEHIDALAARFPPPRYYADPVNMQNSMALGVMFNIIDTEAGVKADLVPLTLGPGYNLAFEGRMRRLFTDTEGRQFEAWLARPEDIIIGKLMAWHEGRSHKHPADIYSMLVYLLAGKSDVSFDLKAVALAAAKLGLETQNLWNDLLARAERDSKSHH